MKGYESTCIARSINRSILKVNSWLGKLGFSFSFSMRGGEGSLVS